MKRGIAFALLSAVLFGAGTPLAKALVGSVGPWMLAGLLYAGSGAGLFLVLAGRRWLTRQAPAGTLPRGREWLWLGAAIVVGGILAPVALMMGLVQTPASTASLLLNFEAVFTALLAWGMFRENVDRRIAFGMLAIVAGGVVLSWPSSAARAATMGALWIPAACACWALDNNLTRRVSGRDALFVAGLKGVVAGPVNLALALALGDALPAPGMAAAAGAVGFASYGVSLALFVLALRDLGTARTAAYFSVAPFVGAAAAVALQGDPLTWQLALAAAAMGAGVWLHLTEHHEHRHVHGPKRHAHAHVHDAHHRHEHPPGMDVDEPHSHEHVHERLVHTHAHFPDVHHRHAHETADEGGHGLGESPAPAVEEAGGHRT